MTLVAAQFGIFRSAEAQSGKAEPADVPPIKPGTNTSFGSLKQIDASVLNVGYAEADPTDGPVVLLLHGWPYDIHSYVDVAPLLASAGYRLIVPYLRGYGTTRFLSSETVRNGQQSVVALDITALMDALKIEKAIIAKLMGFWVVSGPLSVLEFGHYKSYSGHGVRRDALLTAAGEPELFDYPFHPMMSRLSA